jgi:signal recognition particle subunit SRP54
MGGKLKGVAIDPRVQKRMEAIILSMTPQERHHPEILSGARRQRIARGSGNSIQDVNRLLKQFAAMQKMVRTLTRPGRRGMGPVPFGLPGM